MGRANSRIALPAITLLTCLLVPPLAANAEKRAPVFEGTQKQADTKALELAVSARVIDALALDIPAEMTVLDNGLTLVVNEDHSQPLIAVNIWYHVGSKDEPAGRTGFAHLFEHLMFNGSANFNDDFFKATRTLGATDLNGSTSTDRTNYYETVPRNALDSILWLESDRMGHLLEAVDQAKLDEQLAVVKNEMRQHENQPYGKAFERAMTAGVPYGHPYHHPVIGSIEDLDAATLDDVKNWFRDYYGPSNAVITLSGDITMDEARASVEKYFGNIPGGRPIVAPTSWPVKMNEPVREVIEDKVSHPRLFKVLNGPMLVNQDTAFLKVLAFILAGDDNSRLYKRLVVDDGLATDVDAFVYERELGGQFIISVTAKKDADLDRIEQILQAEIAKLATAGPSDAELAYARASMLSEFARNLESLSFKADLLSASTTFFGDPAGWTSEIDTIKSADADDLMRVAKDWLTEPGYTSWAIPFPDFSVSGQEADRSGLPRPEGMAKAVFPEVETARLANGMQLMVVHRDGAPIVDFSMLLKTGPDVAWKESAEGTGALAVTLLAHGTDTLSRDEIKTELGLLGADFSAAIDSNGSRIWLSAMKSGLRESLAIYSDIIMHPSFPQQEVDRVKALALDDLELSKDSPVDVADRVMSEVMFGADSPYGRLATGQSLAAIDRAALERFYSTWFHPNNATLIVSGDTRLSEVQPLVEAAFSGWDSQTLPAVIVPQEPVIDAANIYLVDKPGAIQSVIKAAVTGPARSQADQENRRIFNQVMGGDFVSRINMTLREEKGWSYGARSNFGGPDGGRLFSVTAPVQSDKTAPAMAEIATILRGVVSDQAVAAEEVEAAKDQAILGLPDAWSTNQGIIGYLVSEVQNGLPQGYYDDYADKLESIDVDAVNQAAQVILGGKPLTWVIVGDRAKIEDDIRALGLGTLHVVDADGNPVE
ncbi:pitrilysin family protein [Martelella sp. HB161492]|uniref:M16 family metallopeptidase n=1 Tax=Martelella sp. HB161492 TaxID=2720726 RepID=UPI001591D074|nr:pitrilysin family protein [Martelella sp. HB161492]